MPRITRYETPSAAPSAPPATSAGSPDPVVASVYSDQRQIGLARRPRAMAAVPATPTSSLSAWARTRRDERRGERMVELARETAPK
jgi:hypothetical protein